MTGGGQCRCSPKSHRGTNRSHSKHGEEDRPTQCTSANRLSGCHPGPPRHQPDAAALCWLWRSFTKRRLSGNFWSNTPMCNFCFYRPTVPRKTNQLSEPGEPLRTGRQPINPTQIWRSLSHLLNLATAIATSFEIRQSHAMTHDPFYFEERFNLCAQRLTASEVGASFYFFLSELSRSRAQRLTASEVGASKPGPIHSSSY